MTCAAWRDQARKPRGGVPLGDVDAVLDRCVRPEPLPSDAVFARYDIIDERDLEGAAALLNGSTLTSSVTVGPLRVPRPARK